MRSSSLTGPTDQQSHVTDRTVAGLGRNTTPRRLLSPQAEGV
jgi:hypothetical protein